MLNKVNPATKNAPPDAWAIKPTDSFAAPVDPIPGAKNPEIIQKRPYHKEPNPLSKDIANWALAGYASQATSNENAMLITPIVCECK